MKSRPKAGGFVCARRKCINIGKEKRVRIVRQAVLLFAKLYIILRNNTIKKP